MNEPRPACDGHYELFWAFMDTPANMWLRREAATFCGTCPLRDTCLPHHISLGGEDRHWAAAIHKELTRQKTKPCDYCGNTIELKPQGGRRRYCDRICESQAREASRRVILKDIPQRLRTAHAEHVRMRGAGMAVEHIPQDIRDGEREYQAQRHATRRARRLAAAEDTAA